MKKLWLVLGALVIGGVLYLARDMGPSNGQGGNLKIGVIGPLTGPASAYGQWVRTGVTAALDDLKARGQNGIELFIEDDQGDPKKSVTAYQKLKSIDGIDAAISVLSSSTLALKPVATTDKVILMTPVASHPTVTEGSKYTFRNTINSAQEARAMVAHLQEKGVERLCVVYINDPGGLASKDAFTSAFKGVMAAVIPFEKRQSDFRGVALKVASDCGETQALYVTGYGKEMGGVIRDIRNQGVMLPIYTNQGIENKDVLTLLGSRAAGIEYTFLPDAKKVPESILAREPRPSPAVLMAYEAMTILADAHERALKENKPMADVLGANTFDGILSRVSFDRNGDVVRPIAIKRIGDDMEIEQVRLVN